jgi:5-methylcytosine-specific restriction endonuclease McrA
VKTVRLSLKSAKALLHMIERGPPNMFDRATMELRAALTPRKPKPLRTERLKARVSKRAAKGYETDEIRRQVLERAGGKCESCLGFWQATMFGLELDHFFGRGKAKQSAESCWALCRKCHHYKAENRPSAARWLEDFLQHCLRYGYATEAERARARLEGICAVRKAEAGR